MWADGGGEFSSSEEGTTQTQGTQKEVPAGSKAGVTRVVYAKMPQVT